MSDGHSDTGGDTPDTFEDRLTAIVVLIDTADQEVDERRLLLRRALVLRLLARLQRDTIERIHEVLDRAGDF